MTAGLEILNGELVAAGGGPAEPADAVGVFETLAVEDGRPVFFEEHAARFAAGCSYFELADAPGVEGLRAAAGELIGAQAEGGTRPQGAFDGARRPASAPGAPDGVLRWAAWRSASLGRGWRMRLGPPRPDSLKVVWRAGSSPIRLPPQGTEASHKHLGRTLWRDALAAGRATGLEEVLLFDGAGRLVEGSRSNVFLVTGGILKTPSLECGPLPGIVRAKVLALARGLGVGVEEGRLEAADLASADEVFATNSLVGLRPVSLLDGRPIPAVGRLSATLAERLKGWL